VTIRALNNTGFQDVTGDGIMNGEWLPTQATDFRLLICSLFTMAVTAGPSGYYFPRALLQLYTSLSFPDLRGTIGGYLGVQVCYSLRYTHHTFHDIRMYSIMQ
jgi:hypothetical protein